MILSARFKVFLTLHNFEWRVTPKNPMSPGQWCSIFYAPQEYREASAQFHPYFSLVLTKVYNLNAVTRNVILTNFVTSLLMVCRQNTNRYVTITLNFVLQTRILPIKLNFYMKWIIAIQWSQNIKRLLLYCFWNLNKITIFSKKACGTFL